MRKFVLRSVLSCLLVGGGWATPVWAGATLIDTGSTRLELSGDLRLRIEDDWDSRTGTGTERDDRVRLRSRARVRLDAAWGEHWQAVLRARIGSDDSQQSPHFTFYDFEGNDTGPKNLNPDLWYLQYQRGTLKAWAGRNLFNIWRENELFLHMDVTVQGLGARYEHAAGTGQMTWNFGYALLPAGMTSTSGTTTTAQVLYERDGERFGLTAAASFVGINADPTDAAGAKLLTGNNARDYSTFIGQLQLRAELRDQPVMLGFDFAHNVEDYAGAPAGSFTDFHQDDTDGFVAYAHIGPSSERGDWRVGYYYAYIEALAVSSSYAQDDWVRWGTPNQTRATNMKGSEFRVIYTLSPTSDLVARLYFVEGIELLNPGDTVREDGNRFRLDYNMRF